MNLTEVTIPWSRRILGALNTLVITLLVGIGCILVAPIAALHVLLTAKELKLNVGLPGTKPKNMQSPPTPTPDDGEAWKQAHDEEYGDGA